MGGSLYIGLMSGTSADGIDAALVDFSGDQPLLLSTLEHELPENTHTLVSELALGGSNEIEQLAELDIQLAEAFAQASLKLLAQTDRKACDIRAIGSHGQTIRHYPATPQKRGYSLQIGDPNTIAELTSICTVADFRRRDIAAGGQGAPLAPAFHNAVFRKEQHERVIVNIGGMANITHLPADPSQTAIGFDTGPGNVLMDAWILRHKQQSYDKGGEWAQSGEVCKHLLNKLLEHPFIDLSPPKSTGREAFNLPWLDSQLKDPSLSPNDVQATLLAFTCHSIAKEILALKGGQAGEVYVCGGGAHNQALMKGLTLALPDHQLANTESLGVHPDWVEAITFAWLAKQTLEGKNSSLASVTGALGPRILGGIYQA